MPIHSIGTERAETHAGDGDRDCEFDRLAGKAAAENDIGRAMLSVTLKRIAGHRGAQEHEVNRPLFEDDYKALGVEPGLCHHCHTGRCPVGIATQDAGLAERLDPDEGASRLRNYLSTMVLEAQTLARACGKSHLLHLEPEDLVALTIEAAAMAGVPLAGTRWIPGRP